MSNNEFPAPRDTAPTEFDAYTDADRLKRLMDKRLLDLWRSSNPEWADSAGRDFENVLQSAQTIRFIPSQSILDYSNGKLLSIYLEAARSGALTADQKSLLDSRENGSSISYCHEGELTLDQVMRYTVSLMHVAPSTLECLNMYWESAFKDSRFWTSEDEKRVHKQSRDWFKENQSTLATMVSGPLAALLYTELCQKGEYEIVKFGFDDTLSYTSKDIMELVKTLPFEDEAREALQQDVVAMIKEKKPEIEGEVAAGVGQLIDDYSKNYVLEVSESGLGRRRVIEMIDSALNYPGIGEQLDAAKAKRAVTKLKRLQRLEEDMRKYLRASGAIVIDSPEASPPIAARDIENDRSLSADKKSELYEQAKQYEDRQRCDDEQYLFDLDKYLSENEYARKRLTQEIRYAIDPNQLADEMVDARFSKTTLRAFTILRERDETVRLLGLEEEAKMLRSACGRMPEKRTTKPLYVVNELLKDAGVADGQRQELLRTYAAKNYERLLLMKPYPEEFETEDDIADYMNGVITDIDDIVDTLKLSGLDHGFTADEICEAAINTHTLKLLRNDKIVL